MRGESAVEADCTHAYIARMPCCSSVVAIMVDDQSQSLGRELAKLITHGRRLERVTIEIARTVGGQMYSCECVPDASEVKYRKAVQRKRSRLLQGFRR